LIDDMNRLEWIEEHKPDMWHKASLNLWVIYTKDGGQYEAPTLAEAIDLARMNVERP
jgi:hypothetical protein